MSNWKKANIVKSTPKALDGIKVIDLSRLVAGNMTSLQLADFGATIIKVEPSETGDPLRNWKQSGYSTFWKVYGRNKKSLALNFHQDGAVDVLKRLIRQADILIESFRPGTLEKMGLDPNELFKENSGLIVLRISGFGQIGPYSPRPGFGTLVEGMSGFAHRNGEPDGQPLLPPLALADMISGLYGVNAIMMAMRAKDLFGTGQVIDLSLLDAMVSVLGPEALDYDLSGKPKPRVGNASNTSCPRNTYLTKDNKYISISASIQRTAERLFSVIGRDDMNSDPRYKTNELRVKNRKEVDAILGKWISEREIDEVMSIFSINGITAAPLYNIVDITDDPHFIERGIYVNYPDEELGSVSMHSPVPKLSMSPGSIDAPAPNLGEHTIEVLTQAGFLNDEINELLIREVIKGDASNVSPTK